MRQSVKNLCLTAAIAGITWSLSNASFAQTRYLPATPHTYSPMTAASPHHVQSSRAPVKYGGLMARLQGQKQSPQSRYNPYNNQMVMQRAYPHPQMRAPYAGQQMGQPQMGQFQQWVEWEPDYLIRPDDQLDIVVSSAPELSRTLTVGPDGRIVMPMSQPIMAAGKSFVQVQSLLRAELAKQLRDPTVAVTPRTYAPQQIFVGGEVGQAGTYTIPGRIGAIEALFMAGGMRPTARTSKIVVLRRAPNGGMMMRTVDIKAGLKNIRQYDDNIQLRRGDIVYVPQSTIAEVGTFMQNFRNALPVDFNLSYQFGAQNGGTTVISP